MEKTINAEVYGAQGASALFAKSGKPYVKCTLVTKGDDGRIDCFYNACFFPPQEAIQELRSALCQGRIVEVTGNYSEREYEGKDGNMKISHDILVHDVKLGGVAEYNAEAKETTYSFIKKEDEAAVKKGMSKAAAKPAKPTPTTKIGVIPEGAPAKAKKGAKTASEAVFNEEEDDDLNLDDLDL